MSEVGKWVEIEPGLYRFEGKIPSILGLLNSKKEEIKTAKLELLKEIEQEMLYLREHRYLLEFEIFPLIRRKRQEIEKE